MQNNQPQLNRNIKLSFFYLFFTFINISSLLPTFAFADNTMYAQSNYYPIKQSQITEGDIISFSQNGYIKSKTPYDQFMVGVVTSHPAITQDISGPIPSYPVVTTGEAYILVSSQNGNIKKGDYITSSSSPGIGMKTTQAGYTIGAALEDFSAKDTHAVGKILINVNIHYYVGNVPTANVNSKLTDIFTLSSRAAYESPTQVFKYVLSAGMAALSLFFSFILISKTANKGIDALARNPLSSKDIHIGIIVNIIIAVIILIAGFSASVVVLRL